MNHNKPLISVIMSVYNGESTLPSAIKSIISQTYENFELLIVDDASTDNTFKILKDFETRDKRVKVYQNKNNIGLTKSLNFLINKSQGEFIARQDSDDISLKNRFSTQINFLENQSFDVCVSRAIVKDSNVLIPNLSYFVPKKIVFKFKNPFIHGTLLAKKTVFDALGGYDENFYFSQDYKFFLDCINKKYNIKYIKKPLYILNPTNNISTEHFVEQKKYAEIVKKEYKIYENIFK